MNSNEKMVSKWISFLLKIFKFIASLFWKKEKGSLFIYNINTLYTFARVWTFVCICVWGCVRNHLALTCKVATMDDEMVKCLTVRSTYAQSSTKHWLLFNWNLTFILQHCYHHNFGSVYACIEVHNWYTLVYWNKKH